ncbi:MAG TPA: RdgB/HAM1 family non-canonical purine NTP pyrophosphatase [Candidatus Nanoarchaeia archaeon]|nr:RdgB/HAM1 family non-canonical purine NTP pyrophosphatase [Candidatus Nanoarchaeia archaeon]
MKICLITSNKGKVKEFKQILEPKIKVEHIEMSYPEMRSDDPREIAELAAKQLADIIGKPIVVEDSGLFITALNEFPGTCSAYIHKRIGLRGILDLMKGARNRAAYYKSAVGFCMPGKEPLSFLGIEKGKIAAAVRGKNGFGHDPIFIPQNSGKTYGEMDFPEEKKKFRRMAVLKLVKFLNNCKEYHD